MTTLHAAPFTAGSLNKVKDLGVTSVVGGRASPDGRASPVGRRNYIFCSFPAASHSISDSSPAKFYTLSHNRLFLTVFAMASLLACFKCRLEIRVKQQKVECSSCKNRFHRVLCSGISTKDWKENSVLLLKTAFVCFDCIPVPQTGGSFSPLVKSPSAASPFHGFPTLVYDVPSFNAFHDSFLTTSHSTSVFNDFSNLAIDVTNHINDLQVSGTEATPVAANNFNLQEYMDDLSSRNKISTNVTNDSVSEAVMPINAGIVCPNLSPAIPTCTNGFIPDSADISFPPPPPPLSPSHLAFDLGFELDLTPPPPPYPSYNEILNDVSLLIPPPHPNSIIFRPLIVK